jgi:hypothetical protein
MDAKLRQSWEDALNPEIVRVRLIRASIFIAAFEILKEIVVERIRDFYASRWSLSGGKLKSEESERYEQIVLTDAATGKKKRNRFLDAHLDWLERSAAITSDDRVLFNKARECRNYLTHEVLPGLASKPIPEDLDSMHEAMEQLIKKIETWWVVNVELATDPDLAGHEYDEDGILPSANVWLSLLRLVALGDPEEVGTLLRAFRESVDQAEANGPVEPSV